MQHGTLAYIHTSVVYGLQILKAPLEVLLASQDAQASHTILLIGMRNLHMVNCIG